MQTNFINTEIIEGTEKRKAAYRKGAEFAEKIAQRKSDSIFELI